MIDITTKFSGEIRLVVTKPDGTISHDTGWFHNLILDTGLNRLGASSAVYIIRNAQIGTGNSVPTAGQTTLDAYVASSQYNTSPVSITNSSTPNYITTYTWSFPFTQGAVVGNMAEVGIGWDNTISGNLFSRALILNNVGSPTTITLVAIDQLTVYYRLNVIPVTTDVTSSVTISAISYGYTGRVSNAGSFANGNWNFAGPQAGYAGSLVTAAPQNMVTYGAGALLGAITASPTGGGATGSAPTVSLGGYTAGTFFRDDTFNWSIAQGLSAGGIQAMTVCYGYTGSTRFQYRFNTVIPKSNTNVLSLPFRISWNRV